MISHPPNNSNDDGRPFGGVSSEEYPGYELGAGIHKPWPRVHESASRPPV
jgi:hypothetical protein